MEVELGDYSRENSELLRLLEQQELKLKATTKEMMKERQQVRNWMYSSIFIQSTHTLVHPPQNFVR